MKIWSAILYLCSVILYLDIDILIIKIYNLNTLYIHVYI